MANQTGVLIEIKAWLPTGKGLDAQWEALSLVRTAHESGDYAPLLKAASIEAVKTESKTRRMEPTVPVTLEQGVGDGSTVTVGEPIGAAAPVEGEPVATADELPPESNVGEAPIEQPSLVPDEETLPNPVRKKKAAA